MLSHQVLMESGSQNVPHILNVFPRTIQSNILIHFVCASICRGPETQITFKTVPLNSRTQKLFKTSITHVYFFTCRVSSPESQPIQVPSPNTQVSNYLLRCLRSKSRTVKKTWRGPGGAQPSIALLINK